MRYLTNWRQVLFLYPLLEDKNKPNSKHEIFLLKTDSSFQETFGRKLYPQNVNLHVNGAFRLRNSRIPGHYF